MRKYVLISAAGLTGCGMIGGFADLRELTNAVRALSDTPFKKIAIVLGVIASIITIVTIKSRG